MAKDFRKGGKDRKPPEAPQAQEASASGERLNRYISRSGVTSRRKADELISEGKVRVNGDVVTEMGTRVSKGDVVEVNGMQISPLEHLYVLLNKPAGIVTTTSDERGRKTVLDLIDLPQAEGTILFPVGRLDMDTTGVLLLTNDGELANRLMHPRYEIEKLYLAKTPKPVKPHELDLLRKGVELEDGPARADFVGYVNPPDEKQVGIRLHEGRNRQIRRMFAAVGHEIDHLERVNYAGLTSESIRRGKWRKLADYEVRQLRRLVKLK